MHPVHIYQILNHYTSRAGIGSRLRGFGQLVERAARLVRILADPQISAGRGPGRGGILRISVAEISPQDQLDRGGGARVHRPNGRLDGCVSVQPEHSQQRLFSQRIRTRRFGAPGARGGRGAIFRAHRSERRISTISYPIRETRCTRIISSRSRGSGAHGSRSTSGCSRLPSRRTTRSASNCARPPRIGGATTSR